MDENRKAGQAQRVAFLALAHATCGGVLAVLGGSIAWAATIQSCVNDSWGFCEIFRPFVIGTGLVLSALGILAFSFSWPFRAGRKRARVLLMTTDALVMLGILLVLGNMVAWAKFVAIAIAGTFLALLIAVAKAGPES